MRFGLLGDVHAQDDLLIQALEFFASQNVDAILCVGDVVDGTGQNPGDANRCCDLLQQFKIQTVRGNHDRWILGNEMRTLPGAQRPSVLSPASREFLAKLPLVREIETEAGVLLLCHGTLRNDMRGVAPEAFGYELEMNKEFQQIVRDTRVRFVVAGHTHRRMVRQFENLVWINPGALVPPEVPSIALFDSPQREVVFYDFENRVLNEIGAVRAI